MRNDVLIIWGHGLQDLDRILDLVRATPGFKIRRILLRDIDDMQRFVRSVYNFDYAPYRHLIDKTRYLLNVPPRAAFIFIDNIKPDEHTVGKGRFAHTECRRMTTLKRAIRERFNPRVGDKPSEHHVVHSTDHVGQTHAIVQLLNLHSIDHLNEKPKSILPTPNHLPPYQRWTLRLVRINQIYARIANDDADQHPHRIVPIGHTPHACFLAGDSEPYEEYWRIHRGRRLQDDHAPQAFSTLNQSLDYLGQDHPDNYLLMQAIDQDQYVLLDGVHRAAILQSRGETHLIAAIADEPNSSISTSARHHCASSRADQADSPIDLKSLFAHTHANAYVVMKSLPDSPPRLGSDIDLLCRDAFTLAMQLVRNARPLLYAGYTIRLTSLAETDQTHIDLMRGGEISLRLDLHEGLGAYQRVQVRETYARQILDRRSWADVRCVGGDLQLAVPHAADNLVLRYLEYHEWFEARPDKIKHADAIATQLSKDPDLQELFYKRLAEATRRRPTGPVMRYCDLNLKRQLVWAYWDMRDKMALRLQDIRNILLMAITQPSLFVSKLANRLSSLSPLHHKTP